MPNLLILILGLTFVVEHGASGPHHAGRQVEGVCGHGELVDVLRRQRDVHGSNLLPHLLPIELTLALK